MKTVIAIDSFKCSMTSVEAGTSAAEGVRRVFPYAENVVFPIADGGEGTVEALVEGLGGRYVTVSVKNPLCHPIDAVYGIVNENTAVIEMSAAAGITLLSKNQLNPMEATTYGVGQIIKDALANGCRNFIIGIGGSATNDGGVGMLQALGFKFLDKNCADVPFGAKCLSLIESIDDNSKHPLLKDCNFSIACDVKNPLCGENGCSRIFAPQKGATNARVEEMDVAMNHYAKIAMSKYPSANPDFPGSGAAGGIGFAFMTFLNGTLKLGIDLVITGEGKMDSQTVMGKAPIGVAKLAKKYGKPTIAFSGAVMRDAALCNEHGIDGFFPIVRTPCSLADAMDSNNARLNMADTAEHTAGMKQKGFYC